MFKAGRIMMGSSFCDDKENFHSQNVLEYVMQTIDLKKTGRAIRIFMGLLFLSTGIMKFVVPDLRAAFSGQLTAAGIPFHSLNMWIVPAAEIGLGVLFILGFLSRLARFFSIAMMLVATYVHAVVDNPGLFPLQPEAPIIPILVIGLSLFPLWGGGGSWNLGLRGLPAYRKQP